MLSDEALNRLLHFRSDEAPVLSLYVTFSPEEGFKRAKAVLHSVLKPIQELADSDQLNHVAKVSLRADIERIHEIAEPLDLVKKHDEKELNKRAKRGRVDQLPETRKELLGTTIAVFACSQAGLYEQTELPRPVPDRAEVDATPFLRPLLEVMEELHPAVVVIADTKNAWIYTYDKGELEVQERRKEEILDKRKRAGWHGEGERNMRMREETWSRKHLKETAKHAEDLLLNTGSEVIVIGGHEESIPEFRGLLTRPMQEKVAGTFVIDTSTMTPAEVRDGTKRILEEYELEEEKRLVADALERVAAHGFGAAGLEWCLLAVNEKAVELLLVQDDQRLPGRVCDRCGFLGLTETECPVDGSATRETSDIFDEMEAAVLDSSGRVENVRPGTDLDKHSVAAILRFPVPGPNAQVPGGG